MRHAADPVLADIANQLQKVIFTHEDHHQERYRELLEAKQGEGFRNVISRFYGKSWGVRLYLAGKQRVIGYTSRHCDALRFADMALMKFWVYRTRNACEPVEADLNYGLDSVKADQETYPNALELLDLIETHLISTGVFPSAITTEQERLNAVKIKQRKRTLCGTLDDVRDGIAFELDKVQLQVSTLTTEIRKLQQLVASLTKS
jgi:hypothetical protein